ncbi:MAG: 7TM diverse intracellular signaling domain-containing protein [Pseudomonadota bacterium]
MERDGLVTCGLLLLTLLLAPAKLHAQWSDSGLAVIEYYEDRSAKLSAQQVLDELAAGSFSDLGSTQLKRGNSSSAYWVYLERIDTDHAVLSASPSYLDTVDLYVLNSEANSIQRALFSGEKIPFNRRPDGQRLPYFELLPDERMMLLRISSSGLLTASISLRDISEYQRSEQLTNIGYALFFGFLIGVIAYNAVVLIGTGNLAFLFYIGYHLSALFLIFALTGYASILLLPEASHVADLLVPIALLGMQVIGLLFVIHFSQQSKYSPSFNSSNKLVIGLVVAIGAFSIVLPYSIGIRIGIGSSIFVCSYIAHLLNRCSRDGSRPARVLIISFVLSVVPGGLGKAAQALGYLPDDGLFEFLLEATLLLETVIIAAAMAGRIRLLEVDRDSAVRYADGLQRSFSQELIEKEEELRQHIAGELHDSLGQKLSLLYMYLRSFTGEKTTDSLASMDQTLSLTHEVIGEVRQLSHQLHPSQIDRLGLIPAIQAMIDHYRKSSNLIFFFFQNLDSMYLERQKQIHIYRIFQEAISNVLSHSSASECYVSVNGVGTDIELKISDNGVGLQKKPNVDGLGFRLMRERARIIDAHLLIDSIREGGVFITLTVGNDHE